MEVSRKAWGFLAQSLTNLSVRDALCGLTPIRVLAWIRETVVADSTNSWLNVMLALGLGGGLQMASVPRSLLAPDTKLQVRNIKELKKKKKKSVREKKLRATELLGKALDMFL